MGRQNFCESRRVAKVGLAITAALGFVPYVAFSATTRAVSPVAGLAAACIVAVGMAVLGRRQGRAPKLLEIANIGLFGALIAFTLVTGWGWTFMTVRPMVDAGLLLIIVGSLVIGQPFTIQYAREQVPETVWHSARFMAINNRITAAWAGAFAALVITHAVTVAGIGLPVSEDLLISVVVIVAAVSFSVRYPAYVRRRAAGLD